jgi:chromosome segregation ATPase
MNKIETGVDRLVELVNRKKKISMDDAAKDLGISKVVIQEWADFLEEEKILTLDYKFSKIFLLERKLDEREVKQKKKEYSSEKDAFVRKVESSLKNLESDTLGLGKIKKEFDILKNQIGDEISKVQSEVKELEKYEYLKQNLDKDIKAQSDEFHDILDKAHKEIDFEQRKHQELLEELEIEKREVQVKEHRLHTLEEKEDELIKKINEVIATSKQIAKNVMSEKSSVIDSEKKIKLLGKSVDSIEKSISQKKKIIQPLLNEAKKHEDQILELQEEIMKKAHQKTMAIKSQVQESVKVTGEFKKFFDKRKEVGDLISVIEGEEDDLKKSFLKLEKKALAFDLVNKSSSVKSHMIDLEKDLNTVNKKKSKLREDLEKLIKLVKG